MKKASPYLLLADDDPDDQETFMEAFTRLYPQTKVQTVNDGQELFVFLDTHSPDELPVLILLDFKMPLVTGPEVLERLSDHPMYAPIPKVVWSTSERSKDIQECQRLGADAYFKKPATAKELDYIILQIDKILIKQLSNLRTLE
jgi:CheY-like chemotaxis protein